MQAKLYLIPSAISSAKTSNVLPPGMQTIINSINHYIVENERTARRFLIKAGIETAIDDLQFFVLDKRRPAAGIERFLAPLEKGLSVGLLSEAGCPGVADPGAEVVALAHRRNICVVPVVGPSSILLALMASGFNGQSFAFNGYLPVKNPDKSRKIKFYEKRAQTEHQTQIFIEAPYRNMQLMKDILQHCHPATQLCVAADITASTEYIVTKTIAGWQKHQLPDLHKRPAIFLLYA